jgi:hypothetical protein
MIKFLHVASKTLNFTLETHESKPYLIVHCEFPGDVSVVLESSSSFQQLSNINQKVAQDGSVNKDKLFLDLTDLSN